MTGYNQLRNKKLNKYAYGGEPQYTYDSNGIRHEISANPNGGFDWNKNSSSIQAGAQMVGSTLDSFQPAYNPTIGAKDVSVGLSIGSNAAKGAALGTSILPGWGTAVGGVVGAGYGAVTGITGHNAYKRAYGRYQIAKNQAEQQRSSSVLAGYGVNGIQDTQLYAFGGYIGDDEPKGKVKSKTTYDPTKQPTYDPTLLTNGKFLVTKADGSIGQWGNPIDTNQVVQNIPIIIPPDLSNKARGTDNTYTPARDHQTRTKDLPTIKPSWRYAYGGRPKMSLGGQSSNYEAEKGEVVQGNPQLEESTELSNDMHLVGGESHENGGTIGNGGNRIFSDRLKASDDLKSILKSAGIKMNGNPTYADVSKKIGNMKGKFEDKQNSLFSPSANTAKKMLPRLEQSLDATFQDQEMGKEIRSYGKRYARGGYLPNTRRAGVNINTDINGNPINTNINADPYNGTGVPVVTQTPSFWDSITDNSGELLNAATYLQNINTVNKLNTDVNHQTLSAPNYNYNDRSGLGINRNAALLRTGIRSLTGGGQSVNASNIGSLFARTLDANSELTNNENLRRDAYNERYGERADRVNTTNVGILNDANDTRRDLYNQKIGLKLGARNAFIQGVQGNAQIKAQKDLDNKKLLITLAGQDQNGVMTRLNLDRYQNLLDRLKKRT